MLYAYKLRLQDQHYPSTVFFNLDNPIVCALKQGYAYCSHLAYYSHNLIHTAFSNLEDLPVICSHIHTQGLLHCNHQSFYSHYLIHTAFCNLEDLPVVLLLCHLLLELEQVVSVVADQLLRGVDA